MPHLSRLSRCLAAAAIGAAAVLLIPSPARAQSAATLYQRAQAREQTLIRTKDAPVEDLRAVARAYESIVRRFPSSGYADNALWQAALLLQSVYQRTGDRRDLEKSAELLKWLRREYPSSSIAAQAAARLAALVPPNPAAPPALPPPPPMTAQPLPAPAAPVAAPPETPAATTPKDPRAAGSSAAIRSVTVTPLPRGERVTIELSREVSFAGDRVANPDRVFFDFPNSAAPTTLNDRVQSLSGRLLKTVRVGRPAGGVTRVVLELDGAPRYSAFPMYEPFRLVVDLESDAIVPPAAPAFQPTNPSPASATNATPSAPSSAKQLEDDRAIVAPASLSPAAPAITSGGDYSLARQLGLGVSRVVIDAGHGGHDPGAMANGVKEAELVLDIALRLEALLKQKPGVDVVLTRRTNEFIPLEERTAIANREGADLFLSIHANAGRNTAARGIETYFLNFATNPAAEAVAARENATSAQTMGTLPAILKAIALNNKLAESRELATILQTSMIRRLRAQNGAVKDLGVKQAPFVVLIGAQMPSVLAEVSFVTNRAEAGLLKQQAYRQQIAQAICDAIVRYQGSLKKITTPPAALPAR